MKDHIITYDTVGVDASIKDATAESAEKETPAFRKESPSRTSPESPTKKSAIEDVSEKHSSLEDSKIGSDERKLSFTKLADGKRSDSIESPHLDDKTTESKKSSPLDKSNAELEESTEQRKDSISKSTDATTEHSGKVEKSPESAAAQKTSPEPTAKDLTTFSPEKDDSGSPTLFTTASGKDSSAISSPQEKHQEAKVSPTATEKEVTHGAEKPSPDQQSRKDSSAPDSTLQTFLEEDMLKDKKLESTDVSTVTDIHKKDLQREKQTELSTQSAIEDTKTSADAIRKSSIAKTSPEEPEDLVKSSSPAEISTSDSRKGSLIRSPFDEKRDDLAQQPLEEKPAAEIAKESISKISSTADALRKDSIRKLSPDEEKDSKKPLVDAEKYKDELFRKDSITGVSPTQDSDAELKKSPVSSTSTGILRKDSLKPSPEEKLTDSRQQSLENGVQSLAESLRRDSTDALRRESLPKILSRGQPETEKPPVGDVKLEGHSRRESIVMTAATFESGAIADDSRKSSLAPSLSEEKQTELDFTADSAKSDSVLEDPSKLAHEEKKKTDSLKSPTTVEASIGDMVKRESPGEQPLVKHSLKEGGLDSAGEDSTAKPTSVDSGSRSEDLKDSLESLPVEIVESIDKYSTGDTAFEKEPMRKDSMVKTSPTVDSSSKSESVRKDSLKSSPTEIEDTTRKSSIDDKTSEIETVRRDSAVSTFDTAASVKSPGSLRADSSLTSSLTEITDSTRKSSVDGTAFQKTARKDSIVKVSPTIESSSSPDVSRRDSSKSPTAVIDDLGRKSSVDGTTLKQETARKDSITKTSTIIESSSTPEGVRKDSLRSSPTEITASISTTSIEGTTEKAIGDSTMKTSSTSDISSVPGTIRQHSLKSTTEITGSGRKSSIDGEVSEKEIMKKDFIAEVSSTMDLGSSTGSLRKDSLKSSPTEVSDVGRKPSIDTSILEKETDSITKTSPVLDAGSSLRNDSMKSSSLAVTDSTRTSSIDSTIFPKENDEEDSLIKTPTPGSVSSDQAASTKDSLASSPTEKTDSIRKSSTDSKILEKETGRKDSLKTSPSTDFSSSLDDSKDATKSPTETPYSTRKSSVDVRIIEKETLRKDSITTSSTVVSNLDKPRKDSITTSSAVVSNLDTPRKDSLTASPSAKGDSTRKSSIDVEVSEKTTAGEDSVAKTTSTVTSSSDDLRRDSLKSSPTERVDLTRKPSAGSVLLEKTTALEDSAVKASPVTSSGAAILRKDSVTVISESGKSRRPSEEVDGSADLISSVHSLEETTTSTIKLDERKKDSLVTVSIDEKTLDLTKTRSESPEFSSSDSKVDLKKISPGENTTEDVETIRKSTSTKSSPDDGLIHSTSVASDATISSLKQEKTASKYTPAEDLQVTSIQRKDSLVRRSSITDEEVRSSATSPPTESTDSRSEVFKKDAAAKSSSVDQYSACKRKQEDEKSESSRSFDKKDEEESRKRSIVPDSETSVPIKRGSFSKLSPEVDEKVHTEPTADGESPETLSSVISFAERSSDFQAKSSDFRKDSFSYDSKRSLPPSPQENGAFSAVTKYVTETEVKSHPLTDKERGMKEKTESLSTDPSKAHEFQAHKSTGSSETVKVEAKMGTHQLTGQKETEIADKVSPSSDSSESEKFSKSDSISVCTEKLISEKEQTKEGVAKGSAGDSKPDTVFTSVTVKSGVIEDRFAGETESAVLQTETTPSKGEIPKHLQTGDIQGSLGGSNGTITDRITTKSTTELHTETEDRRERTTDGSKPATKSPSPQEETNLSKITPKTDEGRTFSEFSKDSSPHLDTNIKTEKQSFEEKQLKTQQQDQRQMIIAETQFGETKTQIRETLSSEQFIEKESRSSEFSTPAFNAADSIKIKQQFHSDELSQSISSTKLITSESSEMKTKPHSEVEVTDSKSSKASTKESDQECREEFFDAASEKSPLAYSKFEIKDPKISTGHETFSEAAMKTSIYQDATSESVQQQRSSDSMLKEHMKEDTSDKVEKTKIFQTTGSMQEVNTELQADFLRSPIGSTDNDLMDVNLSKQTEDICATSSRQTTTKPDDVQKLHDSKAEIITKTADPSVPLSTHSDIKESECKDQSEIKTVISSNESQSISPHKPAEKCVSEPLGKTRYEFQKLEKFGKQTSCPEGNETDSSSDEETRSKKLEKTSDSTSSWRSPTSIVTSIFSSVVSSAGDLKDQVLLM